LRVGVIGCGNIAQKVHLRVLRRLDGVEVAAVAEPDDARRVAGQRLAGCAVIFADYRELLALPGLDAVVIAAPNILHAEIAVEAFGRGKHVYLEKPISTTADEGARVLDAWCQAGTVGMVGFNYRFNPLYLEIRRTIASGRLGKLAAARSVFSSSSKRSLSEWKHDRRDGGGPLLNMASHHADLLYFFFAQRVREVFAAEYSIVSEGDTAAVQFRLESGLVVQSFFSHSAVEEDGFVICGQEGRLSVDRFGSLHVELAGPGYRGWLSRWETQFRSLARLPYLAEKMFAPNHETSYRPAMAHFVDSVRRGRAASPDLDDGYRSLQVVLAAEQSACTGKPVTLA